MLQHLTEWIHEWKIKDRRINILSDHISHLIPKNSSILDVGCGDGKIASSISKRTNSRKILGIDILLRNDCKIPSLKFDGINLPFKTNTFDYILLIDVLHHTDYQKELLIECTRVSKNGIILKDHKYENKFQYQILRFMDRVGNSRFDVNLPHNYLTANEWEYLFNFCHLKSNFELINLDLYPRPFNYLFDNNLHFISLLKSVE